MGRSTGPLARIGTLALVLGGTFASAGAAQEQKPNPTPTRSVEQIDEEREAAILQRKREMLEEGGNADEKGEFKGKEDGAASVLDLNRAVRAIVSTKPPRIPPGGSGELHIVLAFRGDLIVTSGSHFAATYAQSQGPVEFGGFALSEPSVGRLTAGFEGQPVYENTATISIPISIAADAKHQSYRVAATIEADLTHGVSKNAVGRHVMVCGGNVEVGDPLPVPKLRGTGQQPAFAGPVDTVVDARSDAPDAAGMPQRPEASRGTPAGEITPLAGEPGSRGEPRDASPAPVVDAAAEPPMGLWIGAGVFALALLGMLLMRRR